MRTFHISAIVAFVNCTSGGVGISPQLAKADEPAKKPNILSASRTTGDAMRRPTPRLKRRQLPTASSKHQTSTRLRVAGCCFATHSCLRHHARRAAYAFEKSGMGFDHFFEAVTKMRKDGKTLEQARTAIYAQVEGNFGAFLKSRDTNKPFFFWFGPTTTHRLWVKGSGKSLGGIDPNSLKGKMPKFLPDVPEVREGFADYLGEAQAFDAYVGVLLKQLKDASELDNTIVVISGDHGMPGVPGGKCNMCSREVRYTVTGITSP